MDEQVICQICGTGYPAGTTYCGICCCEIQEARGSWEADVEISEDSCDSAASGDDGNDSSAIEETLVSDGLVQCVECGSWGNPGDQCPQCMANLPGGDCSQVSAAPTVAIRMPDGERLQFALGSVIEIGRESSDECVAKALESFPVISRKHCRLRISIDGRSVEVTDLNSLNKTWVEDSRDSLRPFEPQVFTLPVMIRLGQRLRIEIG